MQLRLAHGALEAEQQAVVEMAWIIDAILVEDQRLRRNRSFRDVVFGYGLAP